MAKIESMEGNRNSNYKYLFGDDDLGYLMSKIHAAQISQGTELEKIIVSLIPPQRLTTFDKIMSKVKSSNIEVVYKLKKMKSGRGRGIEVDFSVFNHLQKTVHIVELKSSSKHDTEKVAAILKKLQIVSDHVTEQIKYTGRFYICPFYSTDISEDLDGLKNQVRSEEIMTGLQLCELLGIDPYDIEQRVKIDQAENLRYLFKEIQSIADRAGSDLFASSPQAVLSEPIYQMELFR